MNRLVAAATVGALALAALPTPDAAAQDLPKETTDARGETFYLNDEGTHYVTDIQEAAKPYAELDSTQQEKAVDIADAAVAGLIETGIIREANAPEPSLDDDTTPEERAHDELLREAFRHNTPQEDLSPTVGSLDLEDRNAFRSVAGATEVRQQDQQDIYEVESVSYTHLTLPDE